MEGLGSRNFPVVIGKEYTPHVASTIFKLLDYKELVKSRAVSSAWRDVVDSKTSLWTDPEHYLRAASEGRLDICQKIIERVDNKNPSVKLHTRWQAAMQNQEYVSPLHIAANGGHIDICRLIMSNLVDKNPENAGGKTPLHFAAACKDRPWGYGGLEVYQLIMNEADDKNPRDKQGGTPLHVAAMGGNFQTCKLILEHVDEKNPADGNGRTPLHEAARKGHTSVFHLIFDNEIGIEFKNPPDGQGNTPLHIAASCGAGKRRHRMDDLNICRLILNYVDDKHPVNDDGHTPLDLAKIWLHYEKDMLTQILQLWSS